MAASSRAERDLEGAGSGGAHQSGPQIAAEGEGLFEGVGLKTTTSYPRTEAPRRAALRRPAFRPQDQVRSDLGRAGEVDHGKPAERRNPARPAVDGDDPVARPEGQQELTRRGRERDHAFRSGERER